MSHLFCLWVVVAKDEVHLIIRQHSAFGDRVHSGLLLRLGIIRMRAQQILEV